MVGYGTQVNEMSQHKSNAQNGERNTEIINGKERIQQQHKTYSSRQRLYEAVLINISVILFILFSYLFVIG